jgi:transcriptional regulator with XRE-family HTH domain
MKYEMGNANDILDVLPSIRGLAPRMRGRNEVQPIPQFGAMAKKLRRRSSRVCLASNLRAARSLFRWSQEELGFQCGLKRTYIGALERREVNPGIDNLDKLAVGVGVHTHVLLQSPELAYTEIYGAFSSTSEPAHSRRLAAGSFGVPLKRGNSQATGGRHDLKTG